MNRRCKEQLLAMLLEKDNRQFKKNCHDRFWRLNNLYYIKSKEGNKILFKFNNSQSKFYTNMHYLNIILKARQLGFTTLIQLIMLDACIFNDNISSAVIAQTRNDAEEFFDTKIKFAWDNIDQRIKDKLSVDNNTARTLKFSNGSKIIVGTSGRSGTYQYLHISEFGKICASFPSKALEIRTGALNTVAKGQMVFIESTAEGTGGDFYNMVQNARKNKLENKILTEMDYKFHFFPWYDDKNYTLSDNIVFSKKMTNYINELKTSGLILSTQQYNWYYKQSETQLNEMKREYPSTPDEAFEAAIDGSYFSQQMSKIREKDQITRVPILLELPVHTAWDLGMSDYMSIFFFQIINHEYRFVNYYENNSEGIQHYINYLTNYQNKMGFVWGTHLGPHDLSVRELSRDGNSRQSIFRELGINFELVPRIKAKMDSIQSARTILPNCWFDETQCSTGIAHLDKYRKDWNKVTGMWRDQPCHDISSNCADAFQTFANGYKLIQNDEMFEESTIQYEW